MKAFNKLVQSTPGLLQISLKSLITTPRGVIGEVWCGFLLVYAPTPYSAVFLLHVPAPAPIKICFGTVRCGSCGCVSEAYVGEFVKIRKINATLRRNNIIFKVIIAPTLKEFCF